MSGYRPAQWVPQVERKLLEATAAQEADAKAHNTEIDSRVAELVAKTRPSSRPSPRACSPTASHSFPSRFEQTRARRSKPRPASGRRSRSTSRPSSRRPSNRPSPSFRRRSPRSIRNTSLSPRRSRRASPPRKPASTRLPRSAPLRPARRREDSHPQARRLHAARPRSRPGRAAALATPQPFALVRLKRRTPGPAVDGWRSRNGSPSPDIR